MFIATSVLSLVLCVATVALWVRSWSVADEFAGGFTNPTTDRIIAADPYREKLVSPGMACTHYAGRLLIRHFPALMVYKNNGHWWHRNPLMPDLIASVDNVIFPHSRLAFAGFRFATVIDGEWDLLIPDYALAVLFAATPLLWLSSALRCKSRSAKGCCTLCGYDLRASADRCPECGTPIPAHGVA